MSGFRRFEILIPSQFNDGKPVPEELLAETLVELEARFGAVSCESQTIHGRWRHEGDVFRYQLIRVFVDVADADEHRQFFIQYKQRLKTRFQQLDIWITTHPIEVI